ncbi:MAG: hypothetical protein NT007_16830 [Candidatus Kapabacteria bacterium]|nr:hypothetical protein [Candidatus Kapabacteria bacterium]
MGEFKDMFSSFEELDSFPPKNENDSNTSSQSQVPSEDELKINPFAEVFNRDDVINTPEDKWRTAIVKQFLSKGKMTKESELRLKLNLVKDIDIDILIDSVVKFSEENWKTRKFETQNVFDESEDIPDEERLGKFFKDYLVAPKISGTLSGIPDTHFIPSEKTVETGKRVEISDHHDKEDIDRLSATVVINRQDSGQIDSIEVICTCGERTMINFDLVETEGEEQIIEINRHNHDFIANIENESQFQESEDKNQESSIENSENHSTNNFSKDEFEKFIF